MKELFKKFTSILMVIVTLLDMFLGPICVLASEVDAKSGDLRLGNEYKSEIGESVSATEGSFKSEGDVEIRKTVTKLDNNGKYEVKFEARGKDTSETTYNEAPIYTVIVFDRSNSMNDKKNKWSNAKSGARKFATELIKKYENSKEKAYVALVTFGTYANIKRDFANVDFEGVSDNDLFGSTPGNSDNGGTNLHDGLIKANELLSKAPSNAIKYVVVIGDGAPTFYMSSHTNIWGEYYLKGNGSSTSENNLKSTFAEVEKMKKNNTEIFTIGYDLDKKVICKYNNIDYTAEKVLQTVASDNNHYFASSTNNIVDAFDNIIGQTTTYSPAAKNLVITDNIGSAFTSESDTDKDGKITLNLDKTTSEWQEIGKFEIQIDKNSTTGWHNTNDNFTYTWEGLGETKESTKNPQVYWIQPEYAYTIKHVEKYNESNVLDAVNGKANYGSTIEVKEKSFKGYTYDSKDKDNIVIDEENNVAIVYYIRNSYNYTIKHVEKNNESNVLGTDTGSAKYQDKIDVNAKEFKGYTYDSKDKTSIIIDEENNTATVYYVRNNYNYIIKHVEKGNESNVLGTDTGSANYQDKIDVKEKTFKGFTYDSKDKETIVIDEKNNTAIVYYTRNSYNYTIKHVEKGNESNVLSTETGSANYQDKINVNEKSFAGYTYDSKDKDAIIIDEENNIAIVYYTRNNYNYIIKHVEKNNENNVLETVTGNANYQDKINVETKSFKGYTYDSKDKDTIVIDTENNTATVYYTRNSYNYTIKHVEKNNENNVLEEENGSANYQDKINVKEKTFKGFTYDSKDKETIVIDEENNTATVYYTRNNYNYIIKHVEKGNESNVLGTDTGSANYKDVIDVKEKTFKGYTFDRKNKNTIVIDTENNTAIVYYTRNSYNYTIKHVEKNNESNVLETVTGTAKYEDVIKVTGKTFAGYTYDGQNKDAIVIDTENNTAIVYYVRNNYNYIIKHVEKNNETNVLGTDSGNANYQDKIDVKEKTFKGFTYDSKDKETIVIDEKNNTAIVYYTRNSYNYTIKHVEKNNESNVLGTDTGSANYQDKIDVKEKTFKGFTYDSKNKDLIVIDAENNTAIVYYTRNSYNYTIKHVEKNNENNVLEKVTGNANYQDKINVETKSFKGFTYDSKDKETIIIDTENNTAIVYYVRNNYDYTIKHVEKGNENNILEEETKSANYEDVIKVTEKSFKGFTYDSKDKETILIDTENNIATVYYTRNNYNYTIKHVEKGNENNVLEEETASANYEDVIKVTEKEFNGFTYDSKDKETIVIDTENNTATVYYTRNNYNYTIKHVEKGNENNVLEEETKSANYEDVIKVTEKEFKGFTYDSKDKETIIIDEENNTATVYYVRNSYNYIIKHVEKGNENNVLETVTGKAKYEDVIKVTEKSFKGFTYDSKDKETIIIDEENNTATVYYTRNKYSYKVEHYLETKDGKFELKDTDEIKDVLYESKITYNVRNYENYNYDASKTINPEYVLEGNEVVKLYYLLGENEVIVHYVVKVDDNYIPFTKAAYDANGKLVSNFEGVTLTDAKFVGKIGSTFTTELRYVYEYAFLGIYEGNILVDTNIPKLEGDTITSTIDFETKEYTYVYESPKGGDVPVPPDTGVNNFSYANYLLLLVIAYLLKKYTTTEN